jgi:hypothetical protein
MIENILIGFAVFIVKVVCLLVSVVLVIGWIADVLFDKVFKWTK